EDDASQRPQTAWLHFYADDEQQQHDTEFGNIPDIASGGAEGQSPGSDDHTTEQKAEYGSQPQTLGDRHRDYSSQQEDGNFTDEWRHAAAYLEPGSSIRDAIRVADRFATKTARAC